MPWPDMADRMLGVTVRTFSHSSQAGEPLTEYVPRIGSAYPIRGVFDKAYVSVDTGGQAPVQSVSPVLGVQLSELRAAVDEGDKVRIDGVLYWITLFQPDGVAGALLKLNEA